MSTAATFEPVAAEQSAGEELADRFLIKQFRTELHESAVETYNLNVTDAGPLWQNLKELSEELINTVEDLDFDETQERLQSLEEMAFTYLQQRLEFFKEREALLQSIFEEWDGIAAERKKFHEDLKVDVRAKLVAAGKLTDTTEWKRGAEKQANRHLDEEVKTMASVVESKKNYYRAQEERDNILRRNRGISELELRQDLRSFIARRIT